jgi:hypothetical protein
MYPATGEVLQRGVPKGLPYGGTNSVEIDSNHSEQITIRSGWLVVRGAEDRVHCLGVG